jgi:hypothetical protein
MSRPKPKILIEHLDKKTYKSEQILDAEFIYSVFYKGKPFNLRTIMSAIGEVVPKYKKIAFSNPGHAFNLADRLNKLFNTDEFKVYKLTSGILYTEQEYKDEKNADLNDTSTAD